MFAREKRLICTVFFTRTYFHRKDLVVVGFVYLGLPAVALLHYYSKTLLKRQ